jgi:hypothetical protein
MTKIHSWSLGNMMSQLFSNKKIVMEEKVKECSRSKEILTNVKNKSESNISNSTCASSPYKTEMHSMNEENICKEIPEYITEILRESLDADINARGSFRKMISNKWFKGNERMIRDLNEKFEFSGERKLKELQKSNQWSKNKVNKKTKNIKITQKNCFDYNFHNFIHNEAPLIYATC